MRPSDGSQRDSSATRTFGRIERVEKWAAAHLSPALATYAVVKVRVSVAPSQAFWFVLVSPMTSVPVSVID